MLYKPITSNAFYDINVYHVKLRYPFTMLTEKSNMVGRHGLE